MKLPNVLNKVKEAYNAREQEKREMREAYKAAYKPAMINAIQNRAKIDAKMAAKKGVDLRPTSHKVAEAIGRGGLHVLSVKRDYYKKNPSANPFGPPSNKPGRW